MAPTVCDDSMEPYGNLSSNRLRRHCSVINYGKKYISILHHQLSSKYHINYDPSFRLLLQNSFLTAGYHTSRDDERRNQVVVGSSDDKNRMRGDKDHLSECRISNNKRYRHETRVSSDSDNSSDSVPSPMVFHNYAKRRRLSGMDDEIRYLILILMVC